ncbi:hypothetical protein CYMTET_41896 [Cymbomonas tetramitiformis]|uniref:Uncharacterized protein n=1 Tax=Cymbomonas tetramitiformis TaxID=36881 RepID=A0AAE0C555_9CHLO|nr:hypothetical protein CYMTET_41896 [Cymbomonas tetramitiformis]
MPAGSDPPNLPKSDDVAPGEDGPPTRAPSEKRKGAVMEDHVLQEEEGPGAAVDTEVAQATGGDSLHSHRAHSARLHDKHTAGTEAGTRYMPASTMLDYTEEIGIDYPISDSQIIESVLHPFGNGRDDPPAGQEMDAPRNPGRRSSS